MSAERALVSLLVLHALCLAACGRQTPTPVGPTCAVASIRTESLPDGVVGQPYSFRLEHNCSPQTFFFPFAYEWHVSGNLPPGMMLSAFDGQLSGAPTSPGAFFFVVTLWVSGFVGGDAVESKTFTLVVHPAP
jgi:putative Ig domain-containing protein